MKMENYILGHDFAHVGDVERDAFIVPYEGSGMLASDIMGTADFKHPKKIYFQGNMDIVPEIDFLVVKPSIPVMSKKMIDVFVSLGLKDFDLIPVILFDYTYLEPPFENDVLKDEVKRTDLYSALQLKVYTDAFDRENSVFKMSRALPDQVGVINKLVLKEPPGGFPPLFRIKEHQSLFVTEEAKEELLKNNIGGCVFEQL